MCNISCLRWSQSYVQYGLWASSHEDCNIHPNRQMLLFLATFPKQMDTLARGILKKPLEITIGARSLVAAEINQKTIMYIILDIKHQIHIFLIFLKCVHEQGRTTASTQPQLYSFFPHSLSSLMASLVLFFIASDSRLSPFPLTSGIRPMRANTVPFCLYNQLYPTFLSDYVPPSQFLDNNDQH